MHTRIKDIRAEIGMNQADFAKSLGIGQSTLGMLEVGKRDILDRHIKTICSIYNVNEHWLRTGEGEMFIENDSTIIAELSTEYKLDAIDQKIIEHYVKLDEQSRQVIKKEVVSLAKQIMNLEEIAATSEVDPIEQELESYRIELEAEEKGATSSAYDDLNEGKESS
ncbi:helix-turn-helix transcriptional regulator [Pseudogracilibacillus sp. SE30717A]|uniref:helix-turn-helix domain-containing protein n=1 Tax=Pseudogracilibacillus sp. SE30717A TaxID=3098293 RepID=UPI00300DD40D